MASPDVSHQGLVALCAVFLFLAVSTSALRFVLRSQQKIALLADDWLMAIASASFITISITIFILVSIHALGYSAAPGEAEQDPATAMKVTRVETVGITFIMIALATTKASALFFYKRVFCGPHSTIFRAIVITSIVIVGCWLLTFELLDGFQCGTHLYALDNGTFSKYCKISYSYEYGWAISDVLLDVWIICLPIIPIMRLHTTWKRKLSIAAAFMIALAGLAASLAKMIIFIQVENLGEAQVQTLDVEQINTRTLYFVILEVGLSIVAVNMTTLWPLLSKVSPEAALRSIRSAISLRSLRTARTDDSVQSTEQRIQQSTEISQHSIHSSEAPESLNKGHGYSMYTTTSAV